VARARIWIGDQVRLDEDAAMYVYSKLYPPAKLLGNVSTVTGEDRIGRRRRLYLDDSPGLAWARDVRLVKRGNKWREARGKKPL
jgi:hypothetical protein